MPELSWTFGYPGAVSAMLAASCVLYIVFRRQKWL
jgi:magnesium transporter